MKKLIVTRAALAAGVSIAALGFAVPVWADATPDCNNGPSRNSTECGENSTTIGSGSTAVGASAEVTAASGTAIGFDAQAAGQALSVGAGSEAATDGTAMGSGAFAGNRAVSIGRRARAEGVNSIALGADSFTKASETNVVSIGSSLAGSVFQRRLINLAPGISPTDAVNVAQLAASQRFISIFGVVGSVDAFASFEGTAIGANSAAQNSAVAVGFNSRAASFDTAIGARSTAAVEAVAVGFNSNAGLFGTAVGFGSFTVGQGAVAIGHNARSEQCKRSGFDCNRLRE